MKRNVCFVGLLISSLWTYSQNAIKVIVRGEEVKEPLAGASVMILPLNRGTSTDSAGLATFRDLPTGNFEIQISYVGYTTLKRKITLPYKGTLLEVELDEASAEESPGVV